MTKITISMVVALGIFSTGCGGGGGSEGSAEADAGTAPGDSVRAVSKHPAVAIDPRSNFPIVAWEEMDSIYVRRWNGQLWEEVGSGSARGLGISRAPKAYRPSLVVNSEGHIFVAWSSTATGRAIYLKKWNGYSWVEPAGSASDLGIAGDTVAEIMVRIGLVLDSRDNPIVAWQGFGDDGYSDVFLKKLEGGRWIELGGSASGQGVSAGTGVAKGVALSVDGQDRPVVAWYADGNGHAQVFVKRWDGANWEFLGGALGAGDRQAWNPSLDRDEEGNLYMAWHEVSPRFAEPGDNAIHVARWIETERRWDPIAGVIPVGGMFKKLPSLAVARTGQAVVASEDSMRVQVTEWNGQEWTGLGDSVHAGPSNSTFFVPKAAYDGAGRAVIVWSRQFPGEDPARAEIYLKRWDGRSSWEELGGSATAGGISSPSIR